MTRQFSVAAVTLPAVLLSGSLLFSQQRSFSSSTLGVRVDVLVTDGRSPVTGLKAADFELRDNGVLQTIDVVDTADIPVNAVLALDTSASTAGQRQKDLVAAGEALLDGLKPDDRAALTTFSHVAAPAIGLPSDLSDVRSALRRIAPDGETAIMAYSPRGVSAEGFHRLDVRVKRRGLTVKARPGYTGIAPSRSGR